MTALRPQVLPIARSMPASPRMAPFATVDGQARSHWLRIGVVAAVAVTTIVLCLVATAAPAEAHSGGVQPTNYRTVIFATSPPLPGVRIRAIESDNRLELRNMSDRNVVVLGYDDEPYLRIGPAGAFENIRSPATFLNRTRVPAEATPPQFDATAPPEWRKISSEAVARWHDHRSHWMARGNPLWANGQPDIPTVVIDNWQVPITTEAGRSIVTGDVLWLPPPDPRWWFGIAIASAIGVAVAGWFGRRRHLQLACLVMLLAAESLHLAGGWGYPVVGLAERLAALPYPAIAWVVTLGALIRTIRKGDWAGAPLALCAGLGIFIISGVGDVTTLIRAQPPSTLPPTAARIMVVVALGIGAGLAIACIPHIRPSATHHRTRTSHHRSRSSSGA